MTFSISRHGGASSPLNGSPGGPSSSTSSAAPGAGGSLLSTHASRCGQQFQQAGNGPTASSEASATPAVGGPEDAHERQLGQEINHVRQSTPVQGNPMLANATASGSIMGCFLSSPV